MLKDEVRIFFKGDIADDGETLKKYSRDTSIFEVNPKFVVFPKNTEDIQELVRFINKRKVDDEGKKLSITPRSAGTCMTGGPLNESIILDGMRYMNHIRRVTAAEATAEPGVFYRDFERKTLEHSSFMPAYPASREICALGGMVGNNAGGEKSLVYGKVQDYILELKVILSDGNEYALKPLSPNELEEKVKLETFEGEIYRKMYALIEKNYDLLEKARPPVSKNSAGFNVWDVWNKKTFDLTKLIVGSQGTLGIVTEVTLRLVKRKPYSGMAVIFLDDMKQLADVVKILLSLKPSSIESFDDHTFRIALRYVADFLKLLGARNIFSLMFSFLPEFLYVLFHGVPKLVLLVEFEDDVEERIREKLSLLKSTLDGLSLSFKVLKTKRDSEKYWAMRRESFNLLRNKIRDKQTASFIDDIIVRPEKLPVFLPLLYALLDESGITYTIAGHVGNGNFHIIPLVKLQDPNDRKIMFDLTDKVYALVLEHEGSFTAEHGDGIIRTPYLKKMFGEKVYSLFEEVKRIFDPYLIFNPGKKVGGTLEYAKEHIKKT